MVGIFAGRRIGECKIRNKCSESETWVYIFLKNRTTCVLLDRGDLVALDT